MKFGAILFLLFAAGALAVAWTTGKDAYIFYQNGIVVQATIIDQVKTTCSERRRSGVSVNVGNSTVYFNNHTTDTLDNFSNTYQYDCYDPVVTFELEQVKHKVTVDGKARYPYTINAPLAIIVDQTNPEHVALNDRTRIFGLPIALSLFGLVFGAIGYSWLRKILKNAAIKRELAISGLEAEGEIVLCDVNRSVTVGGRNPWQVEAKWMHPTSRKFYIARPVEEIWRDPVAMGQIPKDGKVKIRYSANDPSTCMIVLGQAVKFENS